MTSSYSEDVLVEQPAIALFETLGWETVNCYHELFGALGTLGRATSGDVVLTGRLRPALEWLNPELPAEALALGIDELIRDRSLMTPVQANKEIHQHLKNGIKVTFENARGERVTETVAVIDWQHPENNDCSAPGNRTRMDYLERFQRLIDEYNSGAHNVEAIFDELVRFANALNEETRRHMAENLTEEELAIFDLLVKPEMELTGKERADVKKGAQVLLLRLKEEKLVIDWRKREQTRAAVRQMVEIALDDFLPRAYGKELYDLKCQRIYQHVFDSYAGQGRSVYSTGRRA